MEGTPSIHPLITLKLKLEDINKGFELVTASESIRCVVEF